MQTVERPCGFWCPRDPNEPPETSHGICPDCAQKMKDQSDARDTPLGLKPRSFCLPQIVSYQSMCSVATAQAERVVAE